MTEATRQPPFFSLPTELRLHIAAYVLEQSPSTGFTQIGGTAKPRPLFQVQQNHGLSLIPNYTAASNLALLLVCRQFRDDFTRLALQKTIFVLHIDPARVIADQSEALLQNVHRLAIQCHSDVITSWHEYPFDKECLKLDELHIGMMGAPNSMEVVKLLRRLRNVQCLRFIKTQELARDYLSLYNNFIGAMLKEDHYQRYDAPNAPNLEFTWWTWSLSKEEQHLTLVAQGPKPVMEEEDYMLFVKPLVDDVMMWAEAERVRGEPRRIV